MGSLTEYFNVMIDNALTLAAKSITVAPKGGLHALLTESDRRAIERVPGVRAVVELTAAQFKPGGGVQMGPAPTVYGIGFEYFDLEPPDLKQGRSLQRGDIYQAVIGSKIASTEKLDIGSAFTWRDHEFTVVGIMKEIQTAPDTWILIPLETARHVMKQPNLVSAMYVYPRDMADADALVKRIQTSVDTVTVQTMEDTMAQVRSGLAIFNVILLSGAIISALVGGLAVINTMIMNVNERTREIGLKKAIGATDGEIIREYVMEAALLGLIGGLVGLGLGIGMANLLNAAVAQSLGGIDIFLVTPRLATVAVGFALFLSGLAGLYPAWNAARLDPVQALRQE